MWSRLIRFLGFDGLIHYGEPQIDVNDIAELQCYVDNGTLNARVVEGDPLDTNVAVSSKVLAVRTLLGIFLPETVPIIRCIGLNYVERCSWNARNPQFQA